MRHLAVFATCFATVVSGFSVAQNHLKTTVDADDFKNEALVFEQFETSFRMHADGTGEREIHVRLRVQSEGAARQFGVLAFSYASANETPVIRLVRVHKPDGKVVDTPVADAIEMAAAVTREAPLYSDLKEKQLPVRSLTAGDTLEYDVQFTITKAETPGQFWGAQHFTVPGSVVVLSESLTLEAPKDKFLQVWSPNHKPVTTEQNGIRSYRWEVAQLVPAAKTEAKEGERQTAPKDPDEDADGRKLPSVGWTTFHNWAEVGDWYRALAMERVQPTEAIRARAAVLTKDATTPEEQVKTLYSFVSTSTRYIGIDFGVGRYQPHPASEVMANQYGDCKDKDTLLEALLQAKGFTTAPALIGAGITPVPELPSPAVFNHVITTVEMPGGRIWLDSTPEVAPYRLLSAAIRDEQALVVPKAGQARLERTPAMPPYPFIERFEATGALDMDGVLKSQMKAQYRSDSEMLVRDVVRRVAPSEWDKASQYISTSIGFSGTTSHTHFTRADDLSTPVELTYDYTRKPFGDWDNLRIVPLFPALEFNALDKDKSEPEVDIALGAPRTLIASSRIRLPEGYRTDLPDPIHVKTNFATFDKTYRFDGKEIVAERTVVVLKQKVPKSAWKEYESFTKQISLDGEAWIQLIRPVKVVPQQTSHLEKSFDDGKTVVLKIVPATGSELPKVPVVSSTDDRPAHELMQEAYREMAHGDVDGAQATLDRVKAKSPNEEYLLSVYGALAAMQRRYGEAKEDFNKELKAHPDNAMIAGALAETEKNSGDAAGARRTLQSYLNTHPDTLKLSLMLASLQTAADDDKGALKTLQAAADVHPEDRSVRLQISNALLRLNRKEEATAAAKSVLDGAEDTALLNDAAYVVAEAGIDLPYAEKYSRISIARTEEKSATTTTAEANSNAFRDASSLIAAWDTLGWILLREQKMEEAEPFLTASWRNSLYPEVGLHLGQLYEAQAKWKQALEMYELAQYSNEGLTTPATRDEVRVAVRRLRTYGTPMTQPAAVQRLQASRTYTLTRPTTVSGWGTFRLQITADGTQSVQQMSGERKLEKLTHTIEAMKFPELLPLKSKARLLRSAVVSCSSGTTCELVLVPNSSLNTEQE